MIISLKNRESWITEFNFFYFVSQDELFLREERDENFWWVIVIFFIQGIVRCYVGPFCNVGHHINISFKRSSFFYFISLQIKFLSENYVGGCDDTRQKGIKILLTIILLTLSLSFLLFLICNIILSLSFFLALSLFLIQTHTLHEWQKKWVQVAKKRFSTKKIV